MSCVFGNAFRCCRQQFKRRPTNWTSRKRLSKPVMRWAFDCINFRLQTVCAQDVSSWSSFLQKWWAGDNWLGFHRSYTTVLLTVENYYAIALPVAPVFQATRSKAKTIHTLYAWFLSRFEQVYQGIARNFDWFFALFAPVVIRSNFFDVGFSIVIWKLLCK